MRIYIDTSVINGFFCQDKTIQQTTCDFFKQIKIGYTLYGSDLVAEEIKQTPDAKLRQALIGIVNEHEIELLPISEEVRNLAEQYISEKIIPGKYLADALHIAVAALHNIPVLVSWNFEHMVKHKTRVAVNQINKNLNLPQIDICSPQEV